MIEFRALGSLSVIVDGVDVPIGGPRQRRLLAMLLIHRQSVVSVDRLADAVFAGEPTDAASTTLRSYVARIRKVVDAGDPAVTVVTQAPGYVLHAPADTFDVGRFELLLADGQHQLAMGDAALAATSIRHALGMWTGDAYAEFADEEWAQPEALRLGELRIVAQERLIDAELACGRAAQMIAEVESLVAVHPLREGFRSQLMLALYRSGRQVDSLRAYRDYRQYLIDEIGLEPSPALADLERRILDHDPSLLLAEAAGEPLLGYRLGARFGTGPNGTMHWARLPGSDREYAISILTGSRVDQPDFVRSFDAAAHRIASLRHPAIVPIHDHWRDPGAAYVVTRRIAGLTLRDRLERSPMTIAEVDQLVQRVGGALVLAEQNGVRHGWLSLDNLILDDNGGWFVVNFVICPDNADTDVVDFAEIVGQCLNRVSETRPSRQRDGIAAALIRTRSTNVRLTMSEFVDDLIAACTEGEPAADASRPNPFKGLRAFDEADADDYFGRADLVDELLTRLGDDDDASRLTLVVGGSGSGKSSVVRAGLLPRVRRGDVCGSGDWFVTTMLPGSAPFKELENALRRIAVVDVDDVAEDLATARVGLNEVLQRVVPDGGQLLLVIDQLEELFTLAPDDEQRTFLDGLVDALSAPESRLRIVATLRADFYDRPLAFQRFGALVGDATVTIPAMSPAELESAIVRPVEAIGATAEPALVAELVAAVADQPAALPSLQFTLFELADRRSDRCLTLVDYRDLGSVDAAIGSRAEALYRSMDAPGREAVRQLLEQLVVVGIDTEPTSRRSTRSDLTAGSNGRVVDDVIEQWVSARLLTADNDARTRVPTVQVAHEALLRTWPRLGGWIDDDREAIMTLGHLREATADWVEGGRDASTLYRGARLQNALDLTEVRGDELPGPEREFIVTSVAQRDHDEREAADRVARQARANRRLRIQFAVIAVALVMALAVGFVAVQQRGNAQKASQAAERERRIAVGRELAAASVANLQDDPERSILLALAAADATKASDGAVLPEAEDALHQAVNASRVVLNVPGVGGALDWSPTQNYFVTEGPEDSGMIDLRDATTGASIRSWRGDAVDINDVAFSADGSMLATAGDDGTTKVWNPETGQEVARVTGPKNSGWSPSFSRDGSLLLTSWDDGFRLNDVSTGNLILQNPWSLDSFQAASAALSPDGTRIALGAASSLSVRIVNARTGELESTLDSGRKAGGVALVRWSPDGHWIATAGFDGLVAIFDVNTSALASLVSGSSASVGALDWSADGTRIATGGVDGIVRVWNVDAGFLGNGLALSAQDLKNGVPGVAFSPDGGRLVAGDGLITSSKIFDVTPTGEGELATVASPQFSNSVDFTPDGTGLLTEVNDGAVGVWNVQDGSRRSTIGAGTSSLGFALSPDGTAVATAGADGFPITVRDMSTGDQLSSFAADGDLGIGIWSPDSKLGAVSYSSEGGDIVDVIDRSGKVLASTIQPGFDIPSISFSADGTQLAIAIAVTARFDPVADKVLIWDWQRDEMVGSIDSPTAVVAFDPTGGRLATVRVNDGTVGIWNTATGKRVRELVGHTSLVNKVVYSRDGTKVATAGLDGTARIWDPSTGQQLEVLRNGVALRSVAFNADASRVATLDVEGVVKVWTLDLDELIGIARKRVTRQLDDGECRQYLHLDRCPTA